MPAPLLARDCAPLCCEFPSCCWTMPPSLAVLWAAAGVTGSARAPPIINAAAADALVLCLIPILRCLTLGDAAHDAGRREVKLTMRRKVPVSGRPAGATVKCAPPGSAHQGTNADARGLGFVRASRIRRIPHGPPAALHSGPHR